MKVIAVHLLAALDGNTSPSIGDLKDILGSIGAEVDDDRIEFFLSEINGKDIIELIAAGREKLASVPAGGGGGDIAIAAATAAGGAGSSGSAAPATAEPGKEEKVEEKEESDEDMGFSLFD
ncbi:60S acidic ribosomal protein P2 [Ancistrocladus abbreviatus]